MLDLAKVRTISLPGLCIPPSPLIDALPSQRNPAIFDEKSAAEEARTFLFHAARRFLALLPPLRSRVVSLVLLNHDSDK